jgi:hypothetical protein
MEELISLADLRRIVERSPAPVVTQSGKCWGSRAEYEADDNWAADHFVIG